MCRFIAYLGKPILVDDILFKPKNSLIKQSIRARETEVTLNGDGFGVGWYNHDIDFTPGLFVSIQPAWNDRNLQYLAQKIRSSCFFAHVRAASQGGVSIYNCHPFHYQRLLFMHNGEVGGFHEIKRYIRRELNDEIYNWVKGQTDSEHFFALLLNKIKQEKSIYSAELVADLLQDTIYQIENIKKSHKIHETTFINAVITDGVCMVAVRYISNTHQKASSLHFAAGSEYMSSGDGQFHIVKSKDNEVGAVLISSEKLTDFNTEWHDVPVNHLLIVDKLLQTILRKI